MALYYLKGVNMDFLKQHGLTDTQFLIDLGIVLLLILFGNAS